VIIYEKRKEAISKVKDSEYKIAVSGKMTGGEIIFIA